VASRGLICLGACVAVPLMLSRSRWTAPGAQHVEECSGQLVEGESWTAPCDFKGANLSRCMCGGPFNVESFKVDSAWGAAC
jgi:hypothetical protein